MKPIEYSEYKEVLNILKRDNVENSYEDIMKKENKALDTINTVVKYYRDTDIKDSQVINQDIHTIVKRFFDTWNNILKDITTPNKSFDFLTIITKEDRLIFIGLTFIVIAFILFFLESSKWLE
jgi:hypothetical protein